MAASSDAQGERCFTKESVPSGEDRVLSGDGMKSGPLGMEFEEFQTDREGVWEKQGGCKEGRMPSL